MIHLASVVPAHLSLDQKLMVYFDFVMSVAVKCYGDVDDLSGYSRLQLEPDHVSMDKKRLLFNGAVQTVE